MTEVITHTQGERSQGQNDGERGGRESTRRETRRNARRGGRGKGFRVKEETEKGREREMEGRDIVKKERGRGTERCQGSKRNI